MKIGILKENSIEENRVSLTPAGVYALVSSGHEVFIEEGAGVGSGFSDEAYFVIGARHAADAAELFENSDLVVKVLPPTDQEADQAREGQILFSFNQLSLRTAHSIRELLRKKCYTFATEIMHSPEASFPVLVAMSTIAGRLLPQIAGRYLESTQGGRGIILGGGPGVPPASVVVLGGGHVGLSAARSFHGLGCQVYVLDHDMGKLRNVDREFGGKVITMLASPFEIERTARFADVLIGAVYVAGERTPKIVTQDVVRQMKRGAVILDLSIDHGGCVETSKPTTHSSPVFTKHDVIHYCVPNILSCVARTASHTLNNVLVQMINRVAEWGVEEALRRRPNYQNGLLTYNGVCTNQGLGDIVGLESVMPATMLISPSIN